MTRFLIVGGLIALGLLVFSVIDLATIERERIRALPRPAWLIVVIVLVVLGPLLWLVFGRARLVGGRVAGSTRAPDDDPEFLYGLSRDHEQEERIRKLEERLAELDDDDPQR